MSYWAHLMAFSLGLSFAVSEDNAYEGYSLGSSCFPGHSCILAFISDNSVILRCPYKYPRAHVSWQYLDPKWENERPVTFLRSGILPWSSFSHAKLAQLWLRSRLVAGNLYISSPSVKDSGVYTCQVGDATIAYYHVDFQDADQIYASHASLGEATLGNATAELENGTQVELFTSWSDWQACDRCGHLGERKRVGFCYAKVTKNEQDGEMLLPCGMVRKKYPMLPQHGPELRIETCQIPCDMTHFLSPEELGAMPLLVFTSLHLQPNTVAYLRCPTSSIYSPVYWQEGLKKLTHLELLQKNGSHSLDKATGGGILQITIQNDSHTNFYQCYVNGHLVGRFFIPTPSAVPAAKELAHTYSVIEALVVGFSMFLVFMMFLSIIQSCRRKPGTTIV